MSEETQTQLPADLNIITHQVKKIFNVYSVTTGGPKQGFRVRYTGKLTHQDSEAAYDQLAEALSSMKLTPLFKKADGEQLILIVDQRPEATIGPVWVNLLLFALTIVSVMFTGAQFAYTDGGNPFQSLDGFARYVLSGWPFALSLLGILLAHELGHYLVGRSRGETVTLPYFIPFPFSAFGTMGAFINMKEIPKNKKHLMDIGMAGPLIGLLVAIPVLFIGLSLSSVGPIEADLPEGTIQFFEGNSLFYLFAKYVTFGELLPQPASYGDMSPVLYWVRYFFTGSPVPVGGLDVQIHPVAWAGWAGLFVTAINLIPAGQLDGGHILYVLLGKEKAKKTFPFVLGVLVIMGIFWQGWWLWAALVFFFGRRYAEPLDQITTVDRKRKLLGILALIIFILIFTPVPLVIIQ